MAKQTIADDSNPRVELARSRDLARRVRRSQRATWFPLLVFADFDEVCIRTERLQVGMIANGRAVPHNVEVLDSASLQLLDLREEDDGMLRPQQSRSPFALVLQTPLSLATRNCAEWVLPTDVFTEYVPFAETHDYVKKIEAYWWLNRYLWAR